MIGAAILFVAHRHPDHTHPRIHHCHAKHPNPQNHRDNLPWPSNCPSTPPAFQLLLTYPGHSHNPTANHGPSPSLPPQRSLCLPCPRHYVDPPYPLHHPTLQSRCFRVCDHLVLCTKASSVFDLLWGFVGGSRGMGVGEAARRDEKCGGWV